MFSGGVSLLSWKRFDVYVKHAYASWLVEHGQVATPDAVPHFVRAVYTEHERVWNRFNEPCKPLSYYRKRGLADSPSAHLPCQDKRGECGFVGAFHDIIANMSAGGFITDPRYAIGLCGTGLEQGQSAVPVANGAHRASAAMALGVQPLFTSPAGKWTGCPTYDHAFFAKLGYPSALSDWVVHRVILSDPALHVVHIWPRALLDASASTLKQVRQVAAKNCSTEDGVVYEKRVSLSREAMLVYLEHAYGFAGWVEKGVEARYRSRLSSGISETLLLVVRSDIMRVQQCKNLLRRLFNLPRVDFKAAVHATDFHSEAIIASEMLLHDTSIANMNLVGRNLDKAQRMAANRLVSEIGDDLSRLISVHGDSIRAPRLVVSGSARAVLAGKPAQPRLPKMYLLPDGMMTVTGAAMAMMGLRTHAMRADLAWVPHAMDVDMLMSSDNSSVGPGALIRSCVHARCQQTYGSHNPPASQWHAYNASVPEELIYNPGLHTFCWGMKFLALPSLLAYKQRRAAGPAAKKKDIIDAETLVQVCANHSAACREDFVLKRRSRCGARARAQEGKKSNGGKKGKGG